MGTFRRGQGLIYHGALTNVKGDGGGVFTFLIGEGTSFTIFIDGFGYVVGWVVGCLVRWVTIA